VSYRAVGGNNHRPVHATRNVATAHGYRYELERNRALDGSSRKLRVRIFRGYMLQLFDEARRIIRALKLVIITSETDRSDLASAVLKLQILFAVSVISVEVKLALYTIGWVGIDAASLTGSLSAMRARLQSSVALAQPAQACQQV
jgi:hypothetical protein